MANYKTGAQRYNDRMEKIFSNAHRMEKERLERGEMPNPSLTSPEEGKKHGWIIKGREVSKAKKHEVAKKMSTRVRLANGKVLTGKKAEKEAGKYPY